jgi:3-phenylpropionate/trans-cinnamate dioxygenase ferredoxin subunit
VGTTDEIGPGQRKIVEIDGRSIGIFNVDGRYYALRNTCPHAGARLCEGTLSGLVTSGGPGEYTYEREGEILRCPWHGWEFDLESGRSILEPGRAGLRVFPVTCENGQVVLHAPDGRTGDG